MTTEPSRSVTKRKCVICGKRFEAKRRDAKYCSGACRQSSHRARESLDDLDRQIEAARLLYWKLIAEKARALGRVQSQIMTLESQYVDMDGRVWVGGVLDGKTWRLAGQTEPARPGWSGWGLEAAGPPWCPPMGQRGFYERDILGKPKRRRKT